MSAAPSQVPVYLRPDRTLVMGILNVTPNSFSDGGRWDSPEASIERAVELLENGADLIDVGGESTAPGRSPVDPAEEIDRIMPVVETLLDMGAVVSVDTLHTETAQVAVAAGVQIINDVSGGLADPEMLPLIADLQARHPDLGYICQHWRGRPEVMDSLAVYRDCPTEVWQELSDRLALLEQLGADMSRIIIDPGLGFAKNPQHNWQLLAHLEEWVGCGYPVLVGASRKRFLADLAVPGEEGPAARDLATATLSALVARAGAWAVRVHEVTGSAIAVRQAYALSRPEGPIPTLDYQRPERAQVFTAHRTALTAGQRSAKS